jgi:hypothetical protein
LWFVSALVLLVPELPPECQAPPLREVTALTGFAQRSGALSVGLDSVATWCFDPGGSWTGGHKPVKGKLPAKLEPIGDCAKAVASCEAAKLNVTAEDRSLLLATLADLERPFLGLKYKPKRSGLAERPSEFVDCGSRERSALFAQAQARMDLARLASQAQNEYANYKTWLFSVGLQCARLVAQGEKDLTRRIVDVDTPTAGGGELQVPGPARAGSPVGAPASSSGNGSQAGGALASGSGGQGGSSAGAPQASGVAAPLGASVTGGTPGGGAAAGSGAAGGVSAGGVAVGSVGNAGAQAGVAPAGASSADAGLQGTAGAQVAGAGGQAGSLRGLAGAGGAGSGVGMQSGSGNSASGMTGQSGVGVSASSTAGASQAGVGAQLGAAGSAAGPAASPGAGGRLVASTASGGSVQAGAAGAGASTGAGAGLSSPRVAGAGTLPVGGPTAERERALALSLLDKWRYFAAERARLETDADWRDGFLRSRELRECRCPRFSPAELVRRIEQKERLAELEAEDDKLTRCEVCLEDAYPPWKKRAQTQCALLLELTEFEVGALERSDDGNGLPPRCVEAARQRRAGVSITAVKSSSGDSRPAGGEGAFIIAKSPPPPPAEPGDFVKPSDYAPMPQREEGRVYVRVFTSAACVAEVLPGPIQARTGDLLLLPASATELTVRGPCGGLAEVYFGRDEKPRVSETFSKAQPLRIKFTP